MLQTRPAGVAHFTPECPVHYRAESVAQFTPVQVVHFSPLRSTHVRTSPYYPESNGKYERINQSLKKECIRPKCPSSLEEANKVVAEWMRIYNDERLHSGIDYVTPSDKFAGKASMILAKRDMLLAIARKDREEAYQKGTTDQAA